MPSMWPPTGESTSNSSTCDLPSHAGRVTEVPSNSTHSCEPCRRVLSRRRCIFHLPISKSKSCWPSRSSARRGSGVAPVCAGRTATAIPATRATRRKCVISLVMPPLCRPKWFWVNDQSRRFREDHYDGGVKRPPDGLGPIVALDRRLGRPLHRQLYDGYREAIVDGRLRPGQRLPSTRILARELQISRMPVVLAFEQLVAEGYLQSRVGAGSFVSTTLRGPAAAPGQPRAQAARRGHRRIPRDTLPVNAEPWLDSSGAFRVAQPALDEFTIRVWARLVARRSRLLPRRQM